MGLIHQPGPCWQWEVDNLDATPEANTRGTVVTSGGSNADGTAVTLLSALAYDAHYLIVQFGGSQTNGEDNSTLLDILADPAGGTSWGSFIDDLIVGFASLGNTGLSVWYHFPIFIKAGTSIGARARKTGSTGVAGEVAIHAFGRPKRPDMWWCGTKVESIGINAATSKGTSHTPGDSGTYSAYATIGTNTYRCGALQFGVQPSSNTVTALAYNWQLGVGSAKIPGTPTMYNYNGTSETCLRTGMNPGPLFVDIPAGTTLQCRATASGASAQAHNAAFYGVY